MQTTPGEPQTTDEASGANPVDVPLWPAESHAVPETAPADPPAGRRALSWCALLGVLSWVVPGVVAGFVVSYQATRPQLWRDEFASWSVAVRTVPQIMELGQHIDGVTVPYYLLLHYWIGWFGDSVLSMRMPSIIAMTATAAVVALLARRLYGNLAGLWAGLLVSAAPVVSRYGQEARGYASAALFAALATLLLVLALAKPQWWRWVCYAVCVALVGLSHQVALLVLAGHLVAVLTMCLRRGRLRMLWWALAAGAGVAAVAPLTINGLGQRGAQLSWLGPATLDDLANMPGLILGSALVGGALCAIAAFALPRRGGHGRNDGWTRLLWLSVLIPFAALFAFDQLITPIFLDRYLLFVVPLLCVLAGRALSTLRVHTALAVGLVVAAVGLPAQVEARDKHSGSDYLAVADLFTTWSRPGDGVIYAPRSGWQFTDEAMRYYLRDRAPKDVLLQTDEVQNASLWANECTDGAACVHGTARVWVVIADDSANPGMPSALQLSESEKDALTSYKRTERWDLQGFIVWLYLPRPIKHTTNG
jgi:mannosyltransferase